MPANLEQNLFERRQYTLPLLQLIYSLEDLQCTPHNIVKFFLQILEFDNQQRNPSSIHEDLYTLAEHKLIKKIEINDTAKHQGKRIKYKYVLTAAGIRAVEKQASND